MSDKIKQVIISGGYVYLFTENPFVDIIKLIEIYNNDNYGGVSVGYEEPTIREFDFLGYKYPCIALWFDNEDIPYYYEKYEKRAL